MLGNTKIKEYPTLENPENANAHTDSTGTTGWKSSTKNNENNNPTTWKAGMTTPKKCEGDGNAKQKDN